ncbi:MAG TPA: LysE family translocator [Candidatus Limnocylindrales bacterium]|nr:LysE family translocator [Candidatus Limnocylindrales bacterium]
MDERLLAFIGVSIAVVVIPGPDMALVARNVFRHGTRAGYATSVGVCLGILCWAVAAAVGVSAVLASSAVAFTVLKLAGAAYLVYLGISTLRAPDRPLAAAHGGGGPSASPRRSLVQGLLSAMLNPKLGVFFVTLLPQFVTPGTDAFVRSLALAGIFDLIGIVWLVTYATLLGALGAWLDRPGPRRAIRWATGTLLVGLGARVAVERA